MAADLPQVIAATTGTSTERYIYGPRGLHAKQAANGDWTYALDDFLGSVRAWVDDDQKIVQTHSYDPYGHPTTPMTGFAFTGEPRDANGLQYHRARYYNPTLAGWLSLDPVEGDMGHPMSLNGYLYVNGNPVMNIDPTGMFSRTHSLTPGDGGGSSPSGTCEGYIGDPVSYANCRQSQGRSACPIGWRQGSGFSPVCYSPDASSGHAYQPAAAWGVHWGMVNPVSAAQTAAGNAPDLSVGNLIKGAGIAVAAVGAAATALVGVSATAPGIVAGGTIGTVTGCGLGEGMWQRIVESNECGECRRSQALLMGHDRFVSQFCDQGLLMGGLGGGIGSAGVIGQGIVGAGGIGLGVSGAKGALDEASSIGFTPCNLAELALSGAAIGGGAIGVKSTYRWGHNHLFPQPKLHEGWILPRGGGGAYIHGRWYTQHALERIAPEIPEVMAILETRATARARFRGLQPHTNDFKRWWHEEGPHARGIPPMVIEAEIRNPHSTRLTVVLNRNGDVISVIPDGKGVIIIEG